MAVKIVIGILCVVAGVHSQGFLSSLFGSDLLLEDGISSIFANRNLTEVYQPCQIPDTTGGTTGNFLEGTCTHAPDCKLTGGTGTQRGNCSALNTCCTYVKGCGSTVRSRVSYFQVTNAARLANQDTTCTLTVRTINSNICQIRVDIISMDIADPVETMVPPVPNFVYTCSVDVFRVRETEEVDIPDLCGSNRNNHFYIHLTPGQREVNLDMILAAADRTNVQASWNMKVTQLECPTSQDKFGAEKQKKYNRNQAARDFGTLAPDGCLQYFTEPSGVVQTFGYVSATDKTLASNQNYASCFKNYGNCGVQFTVEDYTLRNVDATMCDEMLIVPEIPAMPPPPDFCTNLAAMTVFTSMHPGPVYIHFNNIQAFMQLLAAGYQLRYTRATC